MEAEIAFILCLLLITDQIWMVTDLNLKCNSIYSS